MRTELNTNTDFFVNLSTGSASNDGLSASTPWPSLSFAINKVCNEYINNNIRIRIFLAAGNYTEGTYVLKNWVGSCWGDFTNVEICGNPSNVDDVYINNSGISIGSVSVRTPWVLRDVSIGGSGIGLLADRHSQIFLAGKVKFKGTNIVHHIHSQYNSMVEALAGGEIYIDTGGLDFANSVYGSHFLVQGPQGSTPATKIIFGNNINFSNGAFVTAIDLGSCDVQHAQWQGSFTGPKFYRRNGILKHSNNIPGSLAGVSEGFA